MLKFRPAGQLLALIFALSLVIWPATPAEAQTDRKCFNETGFCIEGRIREYWEQNGGLAVFGFPITIQGPVNVEGKVFQAQWFERNRLELHPENARPYDVLLGRLGAARLFQQGRDWTKFARVQSAPPGCQYFAQTGHSLCEPFLSYFKANGLEFDNLPGKSDIESLLLFGLPLSEPAIETNQAGATVQTQWFERARFEFHPTNPPQFQVLLGLLGNEVRAGAIVNPPPPPPATVNACEGVPAHKDARIFPSQCMTEDTLIEVDFYGFRPFERIGYWLNNPDGEVVAGTRKTYVIGPAGEGFITLITRGYTPGIWSLVFQGTTTGHQSIAYFKIQKESEQTLSLVTVQGGSPGGEAKVTAKTAPKAKCSIDYFTPSGTLSKTQGLDNKDADDFGNVSWAWTLGSTRGTGHVAVTCNNFTVTKEIYIN